MSQPGIEPGTSCTAGEYSIKRSIRTAVFSCHSGSHLCCYSSPPSRDGGLWLNVIRLRVEYTDSTECMSLRENCASRRGHHYVETWPEPSTSFCIEHLRMLCLSRESNPGPPALQASTLWIEPFERAYFVAIRDLTCAATKQPFSPPFKILVCEPYKLFHHNFYKLQFLFCTDNLNCQQGKLIRIQMLRTPCFNLVGAGRIINFQSNLTSVSTEAKSKVPDWGIKSSLA